MRLILSYRLRWWMYGSQYDILPSSPSPLEERRRYGHAARELAFPSLIQVLMPYGPGSDRDSSWW